MEAERFDTLTSGLTTGGRLRRGMLTGLSVGALAAVIGHFGRDVAAAKKKKTPLCKRCPKLCESQHIVTCKPVSNVENELCVCARKANGNVACVDIVAGGGVQCVAENECENDGECGPNEVCIRVDGGKCCEEEGEGQGNLCVPKCDV